MRHIKNSKGLSEAGEQSSALSPRLREWIQANRPTSMLAAMTPAERMIAAGIEEALRLTEKQNSIGKRLRG